MCVFIKSVVLPSCLEDDENLVRVRKSSLKVSLVLCGNNFIGQF